ncbi:MAG: hypothetical protein EXS16_05145 [Gemmataceae bacterium]|nr:hypothetical protein [Gemmataceae bacterium]
MAFNFLGSFQKNQRFWMAAILLICIFTFVFCTGGVDSDRLLKMIISRPGTSIATVGGRSISEQELTDLKQLRRMTNTFMKVSADHAIRRLSAEIFKLQKDDNAKNAEARKKELPRLTAYRESLAARKAKLRYFEIGDKFDDLIEFKIWQAVADRLGIHLEDDHVMDLYRVEFYRAINDQEIADAQRLAMNDAGTREITNAAFFRAVGQEFRVRVAQFAVAEGQTFSYFGRGDRKEYLPKFYFPDLPDEIRAPMTLAQIYDAYKRERAEFNVSMLPVPVEAFLSKTNEPNEIEKNSFFASNKSKPVDPNSPDWGLVPPQQIRFEYVYADPKSPGYAGAAKTVTYLSVLSPAHVNPFQSPLLTAIQLAANEKMTVRKLAADHTSAVVKYVGSPLYGSVLPNLPVVFHYASQNPEAGANLVLSCGALTFAGMDTIGALAGFFDWGRHKNEAAIYAAADIDAERRAPIYAKFAALSVAQSPYMLLAQALTEASQSNAIDDSPFGFPLMPIPEVAREVKDNEAKKLAESWAQSNMIQVRKVLDGARGDIEKIRRELNRLVPAMNLTHGPTGDAKYKYYNRHTIKDAKDLDFLKETFGRYAEVVNQFESLDAASGQRINASEFHRMFFDTAKYSATTKDVVVAWPPKVSASNKRIGLRMDARTSRTVNMEAKRMFEDYVNRHDPNQPIPELDLFAQSPDQVLYWRTAELSSIGLSKYSEIDNEIAKSTKDKKRWEADLQNQKDSFKAEELRDKIASATQMLIDLQTIKDRVDLGYRMDKAKANAAIPKIRDIARKLASRDKITQVKELLPELSAEIKALFLPNPNDKLSENERKKRTDEAERKSAVIELTDISVMNPEMLATGEVDYTSAKWPKEQLASIREDLIANLAQLPDLQKPFVTGNKDIDALNKDLFDEAAKKDKDARTFVQVIPNIAQDVYYVAAVTGDPKPHFQKESFRRSLADAFRGSFLQSQQRDLLLDRLQERHAKEYRRQLVMSVREVVGYDLTKEGEEMRKKFDDRGE